MKKVKLLLGVLFLVFMAACNCGNKENAVPAEGCQAGEKKCCASKCEMSEEQKAFFEKWQNFDNLSVEEQKELIAKAKTCAEKCIAEQKAAIEEFEAKLANFDNLTIAEQKELLDKRASCMGEGTKCCKEKEKCSQKKECHKEDQEK